MASAVEWIKDEQVAPKPEFDPKEAQYNELVDYSHYVVVNELRSKFENHEDSDVEEELFAIAHFMIRHSAWDPYKQSFLAISLIEQMGDDALENWNKVLTPLEKAYEKSNGAMFKNKFGFDYLTKKDKGTNDNNNNDDDNMVAATRKYALLILNALSELSREAGQEDRNKKSKEITPFQKAEREAKRKIVEAKVEAARKAQAEEEMLAMEASEKNN